MPTTVLEIKRNWIKDDERWRCELMRKSDASAVLRYVIRHPWPIVNDSPPIGSTTLAHYWTDRDYVAWEFWQPDGALYGRLYHMASEVSISDQRVDWRDMMLDVWYPHGVRPLIKDADELLAARDQGYIDDELVDRVWDGALRVVRRQNELIDELTTVRGELGFYSFAVECNT